MTKTPFRKRVKIAPGITVNLSKSGVNTTVGVKGLSVNIGKNGTHLNAGVPGTGIYTRTKLSGSKKEKELEAVKEQISISKVSLSAEPVPVNKKSLTEKLE
ncbi:TPA: DUF4236 domain-containing protein, partial [Pasteurella multocida]|nr:DUF4236 domain-containing protein [Pasteurella multocida]